MHAVIFNIFYFIKRVNALYALETVNGSPVHVALACADFRKAAYIRVKYHYCPLQIRVTKIVESVYNAPSTVFIITTSILQD
jgi:hypothetical protein